MDHVDEYFEELKEISVNIDKNLINQLAISIAKVRDNNGRLFILGVGGSAANASHAVNDFRKICGIECYAPSDNVAELTARTNDEGWETVFSSWIKCSNGNKNDAILIFSVGGGNFELNVSPNIVNAIDEAKKRKMQILGIVGRDGGYTKKIGDVVLVIPIVNEGRITPHSEEFQAIIWHCLSCHPSLIKNENKWEALNKSLKKS